MDTHSLSSKYWVIAFNRASNGFLSDGISKTWSEIIFNKKYIFQVQSKLGKDSCIIWLMHYMTHAIYGSCNCFPWLFYCTRTIIEVWKQNPLVYIVYSIVICAKKNLVTQRSILTQYLTSFHRELSGVLTMLTVDWNLPRPPNNSPSRHISVGRPCRNVNIHVCLIWRMTQGSKRSLSSQFIPCGIYINNLDHCCKRTISYLNKPFWRKEFVAKSRVKTPAMENEMYV